MISVGLTLLGLAAIALVCALVVPPIHHTTDFLAQFTVLEGFLYPWQPVKTIAYQAGCVAALVLPLVGISLGRRLADQLPGCTLDRLTWIGAGLYFLLVLACAWPMVNCPPPPFPMVPPSWLLLPFDFSHPFVTPVRVAVLMAAAAMGLLLLRSAPSRRNANRALLVLLVIWLALIPSRCYPPSEIGDELKYLYALNAVLDSLSQSVNGHHLLIDFPHIYGGYVEMLAPIVRLLPPGIGSLITVLAAPNIFGMLCLLLTAHLAVRRPALLLLCGLALLGACYLPSASDLNYGYSTARCFFPALGLLAATLYFRRRTTVRYAVTTGIAAVASIWNLDTGLVLWGSWLGTLVIMSLARRDFLSSARHLVIQSCSFFAVWMAFLLYLRLVSGQWSDGGMLFYFQKLVLSAGYFCLALVFPDMWVFVLTIYAVALAVAFLALRREKTNWLTPVTLMLALLGIGIFSYFMGRSAESNLVAVSYPAILLGGILCAETEVLTRLRRSPASARYFVLPAKMALFWWSLLLVAALPDLFATSAHVVRYWDSAAPTPLEANAAFVRQRVQPHEAGVLFLSNQSGIYYYLSGTVRPLKIPGMIELLETRDMDVLVGAIRERRIAKLFVEQNFYDIEMYRPDVYAEIRRAVAENYVPEAVGPSGRLVLYVLR